MNFNPYHLTVSHASLMKLAAGEQVTLAGIVFKVCTDDLREIADTGQVTLTGGIVLQAEVTVQQAA